MCWELCNVEETFESGISVTVAFVTVTSIFVMTLVVAPPLISVVVNEECVGCKDVLESFSLVAPIDISLVDPITVFIVVVVGTDAVAEGVVADGNP